MNRVNKMVDKLYFLINAVKSSFLVSSKNDLVSFEIFIQVNNDEPNFNYATRKTHQGN